MGYCIFLVQELSGHLAAEITRLCSLAKQDDLPLSQGMDVYEMEVSFLCRRKEAVKMGLYDHKRFILCSILGLDTNIQISIHMSI